MREKAYSTAETRRPQEGWAPLEPIHHPNDSILEKRDVEVDQQPDATIAQLELRKKLRLVDREKFCHGLDLHDHAVLDQQVEPIRKAELDPVVSH